MFVSAIKKAHDAVEGFALEAAFGLAAVLLGCGALLFAATGATLWLSTIIPVYFALFINAAFLAIIAAIVFYLGRHEASSSPKEEADDQEGTSPLAALTKSFGSMGAPMDLVASGLFARQIKRAPIATVAATVALGTLLGMLADTSDKD